MRLTLCLFLACAWLAWAPPLHADSIETFALDGNDTQSLVGDTLTVTLDDLEVGAVTFDAVLTVVGSSTLTQASSGLGVSGGSNPLNDGESLTFSMAIEDASGGTALFDGFEEADLTFFGTDGEQAVFSDDADLSTAGDNFLVAEGSDADPVDLGGVLPGTFTLFGNDDGGTVSFRVDSVDARFAEAPETAPVPEPGTLLLVGAGTLAVARRRRQSRTPLAAPKAGRSI